MKKSVRWNCAEQEGTVWTAVRPGESMAALAQRTGASPRALLALNPYADPAELIEGQLLRVPAAPRRVTLAEAQADGKGLPGQRQKGEAGANGGDRGD